MRKTRKVARAERLKPSHRLLPKLLPLLKLAKVLRRVLVGGRDAREVLPRSPKMELLSKRSEWRRRRLRPSQSSLLLKRKRRQLATLRKSKIPAATATVVGLASLTKKLR